MNPTHTFANPNLTLQCSTDEKALVASFPSGRERAIVTSETNTVTGGSGLFTYDDYAKLSAYDKRSTPRDNPLVATRNALAKGRQTLWRRSSTLLDIFSKSGPDLWLRTLNYNYFTSSASAGVASEFWRFNRLVKLDGCIAVPTATPTVGSYTTASRIIHPHTTAGGQTVASGIIYGSTADEAAITWPVTVPASGIVRVGLFNSSSTAQEYECVCGGVTVTGTLTSSTTAGIQPFVISLLGCTVGAATLSVKKKNTGSSLYTCGMCYDLSAGDVAPDDSSLIYWFGTADRYIDNPGANELAINIAGTFYGSYHGGHYGTNEFLLDGSVVDVLSNGPCRTAESIEIRHSGSIGALMSIASQTMLYPDGHVFDATIRADSLAIDDAHILMSSSMPDMTSINAYSVPSDSAYHDITPVREYLDQSTPTRSKALTAWLESISINGVRSVAGITNQSINTGSAGYCKGYISLDAIILDSLDWSAVWNY